MRLMKQREVTWPKYFSPRTNVREVINRDIYIEQLFNECYFKIKFQTEIYQNFYLYLYYYKPNSQIVPNPAINLVEITETKLHNKNSLIIVTF